MSVYNEIFENWADVQSQFSMKMPEPEQVFLAKYDYENYEGWAVVIYADKGKLYEVHGGHCSCYGLEGQWEPEETTLEALRAQQYLPNKEEVLPAVADWEARNER